MDHWLLSLLYKFNPRQSLAQMLTDNNYNNGKDDLALICCSDKGNIKLTCMDLILLVRANSEKLHGNNEQILLSMYAIKFKSEMYALIPSH